MFECVVNISEGRDEELLSRLAGAAGAPLRDRHRDGYHNRSVFTLIDEPTELVEGVRRLVGEAFTILDLTDHEGVHPRFGVVDVVPFVALDAARADEAIAMRDATARWIAEVFAVPVFLYGELADGSRRSLPEIRRHAFRGLEPDWGPSRPTPRLGAVAVGARPVLLAWNIWLRATTLERARELAIAVRQDSVRALAFAVGEAVQVSCNLLDPTVVTPSAVLDQVRAILTGDESVDHVELVGLAPWSVLSREPVARWPELGLDPASTIEARCGLSPPEPVAR